MRRELKYLVREADRERLVRRLSPYIRPDPHATVRKDGALGYTVRSIYFDSPGLRDWTEKESGDEIRRKTRIRSYDTPGSGPTVLEIKRKENQAVWKDRAPMTAQQATYLLAGGQPEDLDLPKKVRIAAERFLYRIRAERRKPVLLVTYWREPNVGRLDPSLRVTLDRRLRVAAFPSLGPEMEGLFSERLKPVMPGSFILEVKYDRSHPSWMRAIVAEFGIRQQALSKYGMGLQLESLAAPWRFGRSAVGALAASPAQVPSLSP